MIIECINCHKKFQIDSNLIPSEGRSLQCGLCNHTWFFSKNEIEEKELFKNENFDNETLNQEISPIRTKRNEKKDPQKKPKKIQQSLDFSTNTSSKLDNSKKSVPKSSLGFTLGKLLSYIIVLIVSFIALIIIIDTFKIPLYKNFPGLEILLFNFFETLLDIQLFIKDLIKQ